MLLQSENLCQFSLENCFPKEWEKANIVPVQKNGKQLIKNYQSVSLLPVCGKISLFKFLDESSLLNVNQWGFCPGDSCIYQLLWISHEIYKLFDANPSLELQEYLWAYQKPLIKFGKMV